MYLRSMIPRVENENFEKVVVWNTLAYIVVTNIIKGGTRHLSMSKLMVLGLFVRSLR